MKKTITLLLLMATLSVSAQLNIISDGSVLIKSRSENFPSLLAVGQDSTITVSTYKSYGVAASVHASLHKQYYVGIVGDATDVQAPLTSPQSVGMLGLAGNSSNGYNFGVIGQFTQHGYGAGIYGTTNGYSALTGRYAGYFNGNTYINGNLTATSVTTPSDMRLKTNVESLNKNGDALENILNMNAISYNYKPMETTRELLGESVEVEKDFIEQHDNTRHYGLSAQELQKIYPDIVYEGQDGYLGVNYVELVPVLICAIQQLQEEINELKGTDKAKKSPALDNETTSVDNTAALNGNILYQNTPNPTKNQTTIRFSIADNTRDASICIMDMQGKLLRNIPISSGMSSISVDGNELGKGMFLYSLIVNGQEVDTKKMIIQTH